MSDSRAGLFDFSNFNFALLPFSAFTAHHIYTLYKKKSPPLVPSSNPGMVTSSTVIGSTSSALSALRTPVVDASEPSRDKGSVSGRRSASSSLRIGNAGSAGSVTKIQYTREGLEHWIAFYDHDLRRILRKGKNG